MKFWRVEEPLVRKLVNVEKTEVRLPMLAIFERKLVVEARLET